MEPLGLVESLPEVLSFSKEARLALALSQPLMHTVDHLTVDVDVAVTLRLPQSLNLLLQRRTVFARCHRIAVVRAVVMCAVV